MAILKNATIFTKRHVKTAQALLNLLEYVGEGSEEVASQSAWLLGVFSLEGLQDESDLQSFPDVIERLVALLAHNISHTVQKAAANALGNTLIGNEFRHVKLASLPWTIERLVALLAEDATQAKAARALSLLSRKDAGIANMIASFPGTMEKLVALLAEDKSPDAQEQGAVALGDICSFGGPENAEKIASMSGAIERLVALLAEEVGPSMQQLAATLLGRMSSSVENAMKITLFPGTLERLSALLGKDDSPAQEDVAWALGELSSFKVAEISCRILAFQI